MTNPNCRVLIFSILRFISTKCCKTQIDKSDNLHFNGDYHKMLACSHLANDIK